MTYEAIADAADQIQGQAYKAYEACKRGDLATAGSWQNRVMMQLEELAEGCRAAAQNKPQE